MEEFLRKAIVFFVCLSVAFTATARKAQTGMHTFTQPDGTSFLATIVGDEFGHVIKTVQGQAVMQGPDGYYNYACFSADGMMSDSGIHVGINAPSSVLSASMDIPFDRLRANALSRRQLAPAEEKGILSRMRGPVTKAESSMTKHGIVILVNFSDVQFRYSNQEFVDLLTQTGYSVNGATGCAKEYFDAQFHGDIEFDFDVVGPVDLVLPRKYYGANDDDNTDLRPAEMIADACQIADELVDFSQYDDDGDGVVDNVFVFYAGGDEAEGVSDECIWAHAWYVASGAGISLQLDGKRIDRYACSAELITFDGGKSFAMAPIGVFCHEYSHTFGLPDLYDTDYERSGGTSEALWGCLSLMDSGNQNNFGNTPPFYTAIERHLLEMGTCEELPAGSVTLAPVNESNTYYRMDCDVDGEYYLFECRKRNSWDMYIGGDGMLVYHVDRSRNSAGRSDYYGSVSAARRWTVNEVNAYPKHQCVDLVEANPNADYVSQVFFGSDKYNSITPDGKTPLKYWSGSVADMSITSIKFEDGQLSFIVSGSSDIVLPPTVENVTTDVFQDAAVVSFEPAEAFEGIARVNWGQSGKETQKVELSPYETGKYALVLDGLTPSTAYKATICFADDSLEGESRTINFMTSSATSSSYPFINIKTVERNDDGSFPKGVKLPLRISNPRGTVDGILWYFNGNPVAIGDSGYWTPSSNGLLKAVIVYKDGTRDLVGKQIILK